MSVFRRSIEPRDRMGMNTTLTKSDTEFRVVWEIDAFDVEGPVDAARYAQRMMQMNREGYNTNCFTVIDNLGNRFSVDLEDDEPMPERIPS